MNATDCPALRTLPRSEEVLPSPPRLGRAKSHALMPKSVSAHDIMYVSEDDALRAAAEELEAMRGIARAPPSSPVFDYGSDEARKDEDEDYVDFVNVVDLTESSDDDVEDVTEEVRANKVRRTLKRSAASKLRPKSKAKDILTAVAKEKEAKEVAAAAKASRKRRIQHPTEAETRDKPVPRSASD